MKIILSIIMGLAVIAAVFYFPEASGSDTQEKNSGQSAATVERRDISQSIIATGIIKPKVGAEVKVGAQVSGVVQKLYVRTGSKVQKNDLLAVIDPRSYQSQKEKMYALQEIAATELKYAELDLQRQSSLYRKASISQLQYETAEQRAELARARLKQAQAEYEFADLQWSYTRICSPINGVVASITTQEGETVTSGFIAPTFVTIIDLAQLELWTYVDETDIGRISKGQMVSFSVDTYPGESFDGTVETVYPKPEIQNSVVNYVSVVTIVQKPAKNLPSEMTAAVQLFLEQRQHVLTVPKHAVQTEDTKTYVNVLANGKSEKRYISTGSSDKQYYEVISGLTEHEHVLLHQ
jgi:HlyD family secretion protein